MLSHENNELLTRVGPGSAMGELMRRYWIPAASADQVEKPDGPPVRVKLLGESLVLFRDSKGKLGLLDERCPHRIASLFFWAERGRRSSLRLSRTEIQRAWRMHGCAVRARYRQGPH